MGLLSSHFCSFSHVFLLPTLDTQQQPAKKAAKGPAPKRAKRETAKDRAEAYRVSNREEILRDMEKHKSTIDDLLEKRRQKRNMRQSQENQSPDRDE